jgi:hypothetical protein
MSEGNVDAVGSSAYDDFAMHFRLHFVVMILTFVPISLGQSNRCELLPSDAKLLIGQRFPDWRPKVLSDLSGYDKKLWLEMHPKECPGIAVGHFEQPEHIAYAVLLIPQSGHTASYKIIVLSKTSDEYAVRLLQHAEGNTYSDSGLVISKEPPGKHSEFDDAKSVRLKLDGLSVDWLEKASVLYYWSRGTYRSIQTSD